MIREFHPSDIDQVISLLVKVHADSPYREAMPDWYQVSHTLLKIVGQRLYRTWVAEHSGRITGILIAATQTFWWANQVSGAKIASDMVFYSRHLGDGKKMLQCMVAWARSIPDVVRIQIAYSYDHPEALMRKLYTSSGFTKMGSFWVTDNPNYQAAPCTLECAA